MRTFNAGNILKTSKSAAIGLIIILLCIIILASLMYFIDLNEEKADLYFYIITIIGVFIAAVLSARGSQCRGWANGLLCAAIIYLIVNIISYTVSYPCDILFLIKKLPIYLLTGAIGGCVGINLSKS
jgi:putative membrane protein (TIGR04086 family)